MKYKEGELVEHSLTGERVLILSLIPGKKYRCRCLDGSEAIYEEIELGVL